MKTVIHLVCLVLISMTTSCQSKTDKSKTSEVNRVEFAENISRKLLEAQKNGDYYKLTEEEATPTMINGLNEDLQKSSYSQIKSMFGDYQDLKFESLKIYPKNGESFDIYRFKGAFEKNKEVEVRAVLNKQGKLSGFFIKPWNDNL
ncbi:hypothetical protein NO995_11655 [Aestuariibaculum sp. M13]|nr:hypothetical protein [Aestuariibaculum sp. M13]MCR8668340.1 hypothetical protein [Aestuariibaculum sp. M13]